MLRAPFIAFLLCCTGLTASAQAVGTPTQTAVQPLSVSNWPKPDRYPSYGHNLAIVTLTDPGKRQSCDVEEITQNSILCRANRHHRQTTFQRDEIASIIDPLYHGDRNALILYIGFEAVALAGSFFVPLAASVVLRVVSGIMLLGVPWMIGGSDHNNDILLYQRPNTPLTIHLHA